MLVKEWNAEDALGLGGARFMPVDGDLMAPTACPGDLVALAPVSSFEGAGIYAFDVAGAICLYRVGRLHDGRLSLRPDNKVYPRFDIDLARAEEMIIGRIFGVLRVVDREMLDRLMPPED